MTREKIAEVKEAHPEEFARRVQAGLSPETAASVVLAQAAHDQANPPGARLLAAARSLVQLALSRLALWQSAHAEASAAVAEAVKANPGLPDDFPMLPPLKASSGLEERNEKLQAANDELNKINGELNALATELKGHLARREAELLEAQGAVSSLTAELKAAQDRIKDLKAAAAVPKK